MSSIVYKHIHMRNLLNHIESNLSTPIDAETIANTGYVSRRKLYNDFYSTNGHSVKEYIRKRRLSNALALVKTSNIPFVDIAFQCGFSSHQALCRAIKQTLGITPSEYKQSDAFYFFPPCDGIITQQITVASETARSAICIHFFHSNIIGIEDLAINTFMHLNPNYNGRIFGRNGEQKGDMFCYELYLTETDINCEKLKCYGFEASYLTEIPGGIFATSTVPYIGSKVNDAWDYLYSNWLPNSMFEYTNQPYYEEYIFRNQKLVKLKLYLPIKNCSGVPKISIIKNPGLRFITASATGFNAEEIASETVIKFTKANYPQILKTSKDLCLQKQGNDYICGIGINNELQNLQNSEIQVFSTIYSNYLLLESSAMGDYEGCVDLLLLFAKNNGMDVSKEGVFAVYNTEHSFFNAKMKVYYPVNLCTK